jgi:hypothetical protein
LPTATEHLQRIYPSLYALADREYWVTQAQTRVSATWYGVQYELAVALRAAHDYAMSGRSPEASGSVSSKRVGPMSVTYADPGVSRNGTGGVSDPDLGLTRFGRQLLALRRASGAVAVSVAAADALADQGVEW